VATGAGSLLALLGLVLLGWPWAPPCPSASVARSRAQRPAPRSRSSPSRRPPPSSVSACTPSRVDAARQIHNRSSPQASPQSSVNGRCGADGRFGASGAGRGGAVRARLRLRLRLRGGADDDRAGGLVVEALPVRLVPHLPEAVDEPDQRAEVRDVEQQRRV